MQHDRPVDDVSQSVQLQLATPHKRPAQGSNVSLAVFKSVRVVLVLFKDRDSGWVERRNR
jgi:hypothetical protein